MKSTSTIFFHKKILLFFLKLASADWVLRLIPESVSAMITSTNQRDGKTPTSPLRWAQHEKNIVTKKCWFYSLIKLRNFPKLHFKYSSPLRPRRSKSFQTLSLVLRSHRNFWFLSKFIFFPRQNAEVRWWPKDTLIHTYPDLVIRSQFLILFEYFIQKSPFWGFY